MVPPLLFGCAAQPVRVGAETPPGFISGQPGRPGFVLAAPHGTSDVHTGEIAAEVAKRTGFGLVVAAGFTLEPDTRARAGRRYQVNRPFEGVPGRPPSEEAVTDGARRVYEAWERRVLEVSQGPLELYAEIHGNNHRDAAARIEIATVGIDREAALRLRASLEVIRDARLMTDGAARRLEILVEPADTLRYAATGAKRDGILKLPKRALHIELPRAARAEWRTVYTAVLADFFGQAAGLLGGR